MSLNPDIDGDIPALIGALGCAVAGRHPFKGPIAAAKVGYKNGEYILNPTVTELKDSSWSWSSAGYCQRCADGGIRSRAAVEDVMLGAVTVRSPRNAEGHQRHQRADRWQEARRNAVDLGRPGREHYAHAISAPCRKPSALRQQAKRFQARDKLQRRDAISAIKKDVIEAGWPRGR